MKLATSDQRPAVIIFFFALLFFGICNEASARDWAGFGPISVRNQNPIYLQNLSLTPRRATVLPKGIMEARVDSAYSSLFEQESNDIANLDLDMEYWRLAPVVSYGIADGMELGVEIPFIHFSGGFLDGFIQKFHKALGFPNAGRESVPNGRFSYLFQTVSEGTRLEFPPATFGLGDISINFKHELRRNEGGWPAIAWFADFKFPTGRPSRGFGSGSPDFGLGGIVDASWKRLHGYFNFGYFVIGGNNHIEQYMHGEMLAYTLAGEVSLLDDWSLIVQLDGSTPLLTKTKLDNWDGVPLDLIIGFRGEEPELIKGQDLIWQFGFSEDITGSGPSVDFTVFMSIGLRFNLYSKAGTR